MSSRLLALSFLVLVSACGTPEPCDCTINTQAGPVTVMCGQSQCVAGDGWRCIASDQLAPAPEACLAPTSCTPATCEKTGATCGSIPDGCGGTLSCGTCEAGFQCNDANACESLCDHADCGPGMRCEPTTGQCVVDPCTQAGAVCGTVQGAQCGTCPEESACASTQKACIETVGTLPFAQHAYKTAVAGTTLYAAGPATQGATTLSLAELSLATGTVRTIATEQTIRSPLSHNGSNLYWVDSAGLQRLGADGATIESIPGLANWCNSLVVSSTTAFCGIGGDAKYGVSYYGVKSLPLKGGSAAWVVSSLNYPRMALQKNLLFYVGTTDNYYSFGKVGVTDVSDGFQQWLVSGGALDSDFILADAGAYYFVSDDGNAQTLVRVAYSEASGKELLTGKGIRSETTVAEGSEVVTVAEVAGVKGVYRVSTETKGTPALWLSAADLGGDSVEWLWRVENDWVFVTGTQVRRAFVPSM